MAMKLSKKRVRYCIANDEFAHYRRGWRAARFPFCRVFYSDNALSEELLQVVRRCGLDRPSQPKCARPRLPISMWRFADWLLAKERSLVDPSVLNSYEQAFQQRLEDLIQRTQAPDLRAAFEDMR